MNTKIRNIAILAHVDAGKTTLTEQILFKTGAIRAAGRVDAGSAHTDALAIERQRGISIRANSTCTTHREVIINIIDTPGHVDFSTEVENSLLAPDGAVLVASAVEGVQAQTAAISMALVAMKLPTIVFINKMDRAGADIDRVISQLEEIFPCPLMLSSGAASLADRLSLLDDQLLETALSGELTGDDIARSLARACANAKVAPVLTGAALKGVGVEALLDAVVDLIPPPDDRGELSAVAFNVDRAGGERRTHLRIYGGEIEFGDLGRAGRTKRLKKLTPEGYENTRRLAAGDIGMASGLDGMRVGEWLGAPARGRHKLSPPVMRAQVLPDNPADFSALCSALNQLGDEWPDLMPRIEARINQVWVQIMGEIHRQVLEQTLRDEFGIPARLAQPDVIYKETPTTAGRGKIGMYTSPWYAEAAFEVAPGQPGSGITFTSVAPTDFLYSKYQRDIEKTVYEWLTEGVSGWPVTDARVTLLEGRCASISRPGSHFGPVAPLGIFEALKNSQPVLLEPVLAFSLKAGQESAQAIMYDLANMRAEHEPPEYSGAMVSIEGLIPVETSVEYASRLAGMTRGRGLWRTWFHGYRPCPPGVGKTIGRTLPDPLDREAFITYAKSVTK